LSKKITQYRQESGVATRGMKTYSESRIEVRNLQILKKMMESQVSFCHQRSLVSQKAWTFALNFAGVEKTLGKLAVAVNTGVHSILVLNERNISDGGNLCPLWFVI